MSGSLSIEEIAAEFARSVGEPSRKRKPDRRKRVPPVSIRFNDEERAMLTAHAGNKPLSTYVREHTIRTHEGKRKSPARGVSDPVIAAQMLSALGRSEIAARLERIIDALDAGHLVLSPEAERDLRQSQQDIDLMRVLLVQSLGLRPEDSSL